MRFGYCAGFDRYALIASAGYDYMELSVAPLLKPESPESEIMPPLLRAARAQPIKAEVFNVFLPGDLKVTGPTVDPERQRRYAESAFCRASALGAKVVVFGSGAARRIPDGFPRDQAVGQIVEFLKLAGPIAESHGITIAIEPLNRNECNIINSVSDGMEYVRAANHPSVQVLSDLFHVDTDGQSFEETRAAGASLRHVHVAGESRRTPILADSDYLASYFQVLKEMGYDGRISVEASASDIERDAPLALDVCKKAWEMA